MVVKFNLEEEGADLVDNVEAGEPEGTSEDTTAEADEPVHPPFRGHRNFSTSLRHWELSGYGSEMPPRSTPTTSEVDKKKTGCCSGPPVLRGNFRDKLDNALRSGLAALIATGISMVYAWSENLTWFSITLCISGVGSNLGQTLLSMIDSWQGVLLAVPVCLFLGVFGFSRILTGFLVFVSIVIIVSLKGLSEPAKKMAGIFVVWDVLIPAVNHQIKTWGLLSDLLKAVVGANIVVMLCLLIPVPKTAIKMFLRKLQELTLATDELLYDTVQTFCLVDDDYLRDTSEMVEQAHSLIDQLRKLLPHVKVELALMTCRRTFRRGGELVALLDTLETQIHNLGGLVITSNDVFPNSTHGEFVKAMREDLIDLVTLCQASSRELNKVFTSLLVGHEPTPRSPKSDIHRLNVVLERMLENLIRARMRVLYGVNVHYDEEGQPRIARSNSGCEASKRYYTEVAKAGYSNLLPRNAFVMDLVLYCEGFSRLEDLCDEVRSSTPEGRLSLPQLIRRFLPSFKGLRSYQLGPWDRWRQPLKAGIAVAITSVYVLHIKANHALGPQTIWGPIAVCQTMSTYPSSSFKSGVNRIQGTVIGAIFGLAITAWIPLHSSVLITAALAIWVFICSFNRGSATYGEAAVSAALTAPIIVVGPVVGVDGLLVRTIQVILGTACYIVVDVLFFPVRAKLKLRDEIIGSVSAFLQVWKEGLGVFLRRPTDLLGVENGGSTVVVLDRGTTTLEMQESELWHRPFKAGVSYAAAAKDRELPELIKAQRLITSLNVRLIKEELLIGLSADEPELWHKPFQKKAYTKVLFRQRTVQQFLAMLFRSSLAFPRKLTEDDKEMMRRLQAVVERLQSVTDSALSHALCKLQLLHMPEDGAFDHRVHLFQLRLELTEIEAAVDVITNEFFVQHQDNPVLTGWEFIVPLNGMLYSTRRIGPELIKFIHSLRELVDRERPRKGE